MKLKRILALVLVTAAVAGLAVPAASAADAKTAPFTDIADPQVREAAELLRLLGIVNGTGGTCYTPGGTLTRAEFCKMAVELMGNGDKVPAQMSRTIFKDVPSTHWARGYINVATQGTGSGDTAAPGIIRGDAQGCFHPDTPITYAEAVTILMRILGHTDSSVGFGAQWYDGYMANAASVGLTKGLALEPTATMTRGQTALLLDNLLHTPKTGAREDYMVAQLECSYTDEVLVLDTNATAADGTPGSVQTEDKTYKTDRAPFDEDLIGRRAKLLLDKDSRILAVEPSSKGSDRVAGILSCTYTAARTAAGDELKVKPASTVWKDGEKKTWQDLWQDLPAGTQALFHYTAGGELDYIFLRSSKTLEDQTRVVTNTSGVNTSYPVYKNGVPAKASDIRQYDVVTTDTVNKVVYVSDLRLTGVYENAFPGPDTPVTVKVLGCEFSVLDGAFADLRQFKIGDQLTLLFSHDGKVAGAVEPSAAKSTTVGVVSKMDDSDAAIEPISDNLRDSSGKKAVLSGTTTYSGTAAQDMVGQLVTVSSGKKDRITLTKLAGSGTSAALDLAAGTLGGSALAENVIFYERVGSSAPQPIDRAQITVFTVPASKISYVHTNYAGKADILILDDVTGDCYEYGFLKQVPGETEADYRYDDEGNLTGSSEYKITPDTLTVKNSGDPTGAHAGYVTSFRPKTDAPGGIVGSLAVSASGKARNLEAYVLLTRAEDVPSTAFDLASETVTVAGRTFPLSRSVECYNGQTGTWFPSENKDDNFDALNAARAFARTLTVYYDKAPEDGGKIRLVVVEP